MFWVKLHLLTLVVIILCLAIVSNDPVLPYFPIEISRAASCTGLNRWLFPLGVLSLLMTMYISGKLRKSYSIAWFGLFFLAWFDDENHTILHQIGVVFMFIGLIYAIRMENQLAYKISDIKIVIYAIIINALRVGLKGSVVALFEVDHWYPSLIGQKIFQIMFYGESVCRYPLLTMTIFKLTGVMQWIVFSMFASVLRS